MLRLRELVAKKLEQGTEPNWATIRLEQAWAEIATRNVRRPVVIPEGSQVIGIGSVVLGGAGKTPVAIALAKEIASKGHAVALISHGYRAKLSKNARQVSPNDDVRSVGDDALSAARTLASIEVPVFVGKKREEAMALAVRSGKTILIVDGLLQTTPRKLDDSVLVLDGVKPFGSGHCPPLGDMRAPVKTLFAETNHIVALGKSLPKGLPADAIQLASSIVFVVDAEGKRAPLVSLASARVGLLVAIARPERILQALAEKNVAPAVVVTLADHAMFDETSVGETRVDAWLTTARCATKLPPRFLGAPVLILEHEVDVRPLAARLAATQTKSKA